MGNSGELAWEGGQAQFVPSHEQHPWEYFNFNKKLTVFNSSEKERQQYKKDKAHMEWRKAFYDIMGYDLER